MDTLIHALTLITMYLVVYGALWLMDTLENEGRK
jgi:hypothetical protein